MCCVVDGVYTVIDNMDVHEYPAQNEDVTVYYVLYVVCVVL